MKNILLILLVTGSLLELNAQGSRLFSYDLNWDESAQLYPSNDGEVIEVHSFENAIFRDLHPGLPLFYEALPLEHGGKLSVELLEAKYEPLTTNHSINDEFVREQIQIEAHVLWQKKQATSSIRFIPIRKVGAESYEKLVSFKLKINQGSPVYLPQTHQSRSGTSTLNNGQLYKIAVTESGIHKIDYNFLKNDLNIDIDNIDAKKIQILGNGGGMLAEAVSDFRYDDVQENAVFISTGTSSFGANDYILFYADGPDTWAYDESANIFNYRNNIYSDESYYFVKIASTNGKRVETQSSIGSTSYNTNSYNSLDHYEVDKVNLLSDYNQALGAGRVWYDSDKFKFTTTRDYSLSLPQLKTSEPVHIKIDVAARSIGLNSSFTYFANNEQLSTVAIGSVDGNVDRSYARPDTYTTNYNSNSSNINLRIQYNQPSSSAEGWLNYIQLNGRSNLAFANQRIFSDAETIGQIASTFQMSSANSNVQIWDITDVTNVKVQQSNLSGSSLSFGAATDELKRFIAFDGSGYMSPTAVGSIPNQNLHNLAVSEMLIVYHKDFKTEAERLANHRSSHSGISCSLVDIDEVYNEFASGSPDPTAIRDLCKYLYDQSSAATPFNYLLLFGDGSFDYKNIYNREKTDNFIPVVETVVSLEPIDSYPTDDYYALLDEGEGNILGPGLLDIGIGRLPVTTSLEASQVVDKIIRYDTDPAMFGDWKNILTFAADDEDFNIHINDNDDIAEAVSSEHKIFNLDKIYFDAYPQVSSPEGNRYPAATDAINRNIFKGALVWNYMGHGGLDGWAQERVITNADINDWSNKNKLPLFITATCSFAPYDDPDIDKSAGEILILKPDGGTIALFTTVRAVYASSNRKLATSVFEKLFTEVDGVVPPIGDVYMRSKNGNGASTENNRKFTLLGDPSMHLAVPEYDVATDSINAQVVSGSDTIKALQEVTITGRIIAKNSNTTINDFNGILYPTVFDKIADAYTLANDERSNTRSFKLQKNVIFKGRASVVNGRFSFTFRVPKDINYNYGLGKISYYAENGQNKEAGGSYCGIIIGGTDPAAIADDQGPKVDVFMNTYDFAFGGITDENPTLLVKLTDDFGINTVGNSIGHDITAILDENTQNTYVLNDFYQSDLDNSCCGEVQFPLSGIEEGRHSFKIKAWDIANNSSEGYTEFVVAKSAEIALDHVLNYPNPFTTNTSFQFEHNYPGNELDVEIRIFTLSGKLVKTIHQNVLSDGYRVSDITWNGTDDYGDRIGRGVYIYKIKLMVTSDQSQTISSDFEKLVILK